MPRVLLLQVRDDPRAEAQEVRCFLQATGLPPPELTCHNLVAEPRLGWRRVRQHAVVMVGGAGAHSVTTAHPFSEALAETLRRLVAESRPLFASCYGHHALVAALGGRVVTDPASGEVGTFDVELTPAGRRDPLFGELPRRFPVQLGHHDRVDRLPAELIELAASERCRYQALRCHDKPVYSTQFHSEMTVSQMEERLEMYRDGYLPRRTTGQELACLLRPSEAVAGLLRRFLASYC